MISLKVSLDLWIQDIIEPVQSRSRQRSRLLPLEVAVCLVSFLAVIFGGKASFFIAFFEPADADLGLAATGAVFLISLLFLATTFLVVAYFLGGAAFLTDLLTFAISVQINQYMFRILIIMCLYVLN
jgi:hypothetical protein